MFKHGAAAVAMTCRPGRVSDKSEALLAWAQLVTRTIGWRPAAHHRLLLTELARVADGQCDRLLVLMPPGSAKSTYVSQIFPAWWLHRFAASNVIAVSHTAELAAQFGRAVRNLVIEHGPWLGYGLAKDNHAAHRFETTRRGSYFSTGLGGAIAGRRADLVLIDDPIRGHAEADSARHRDAAWDWYRSELMPRLKPGGRVVMAMTRWHDDDIAGRVMAADDKWQVLRLPALAEVNDPLGRAPGAALWPQWEDVAALERKRVALGEGIWSAMFQQQPIERSAALFQIGRVSVIDAPPEDVRWIRAWDLAASEGRDSDYTVGLKLGRGAGGAFVIADVTRFRGGPHTVAQTVRAVAQSDGLEVPVSVPQDPGQAGKQQVAWLVGNLAGYRVSSSRETGSKLLRAQPVAAQVAAGNMMMVRAAWNGAFLAELDAFPHGRWDDQVDALARAFQGLLEVKAVTRRVSIPTFQR